MSTAYEKFPKHAIEQDAIICQSYILVPQLCEQFPRKINQPYLEQGYKNDFWASLTINTFCSGKMSNKFSHEQYRTFFHILCTQNLHWPQILSSLAMAASSATKCVAEWWIHSHLLLSYAMSSTLSLDTKIYSINNYNYAIQYRYREDQNKFYINKQKLYLLTGKSSTGMSCCVSETLPAWTTSACFVGEQCTGRGC